MARPIPFLDGPETRKDVLVAIKALAELVGKTLGPGGRPILLEQDNRPPLSTKDGVTVARHFSGYNAVQRVVADAAREVCIRTVRQVGDGTTTAITLAAALVEAGQEFLQANPNYSPQRLTRELKSTFQDIIKPSILALAKPVKNLPAKEAQDVIRKVALVSANFDEEIANAVAEAVRYVGEDGMIIAEEGAGTETRVVHRDGFPAITGLADLGPAAGPAFVNRKSTGDTVVEGAYVVMYDAELDSIETISQLLQGIMHEMGENGRPARHPVVVVAHKFSDSVLKIFATNFRQQTLNIVPIITPRSGQVNGKQNFLHDLAAYVGGTVFDPISTPLNSGNPGMLGFAEEVKITDSETVFMTTPDEELVENRISTLKEQMQGASEFDKDKIRYRVGQLTGGIATIFAGGSSELEAKERHARVLDAISACRSSMDHGVVPGGGATLLDISRRLPNTGPNQIFRKALARPFIQILLNAGVALTDEEALRIGDSIGLQSAEDHPEDGEFPSEQFLVYDALKRERVEFWSSGIFDPAKVTMSALDNALSVAQLLMTLGGVVAISMSDGEAQARAMSEQMARAIQGEVE